MDKFAERFQQALKISGLKQKDIVEKTGIDKGTISHYANGTYKPKGDKLKAIAEVLNVSESFLLGYTDRPERLDDPDLQSFMDLFGAQAYKATHPIELSEEDYDILTAYQKADAKIKKAVRVLLGLDE